MRVLILKIKAAAAKTQNSTATTAENKFGFFVANSHKGYTKAKANKMQKAVAAASFTKKSAVRRAKAEKVVFIVLV